MSERRNKLYKNIIGNTKDTIEAIQRFLEKNSQKEEIKEEKPAESLNRVIASVQDEDVYSEIQKIIKNL